MRKLLFTLPLVTLLAACSSTDEPSSTPGSVDAGDLPDTALAEAGADSAPTDAGADTAPTDTGADVVPGDAGEDAFEASVDAAVDTTDTAEVKPPACDDGLKNGDETDVDCGGTCSKCVDTKVCSGASDCSSGVCTDGHCAKPQCVDGVKNGTETDIDCGGSCGSTCALAMSCAADADCRSGRCNAGVCARHILAVSSANLHACAILYPGKVKCWGRGAEGRLGYGDTNSRGGGSTDMATLPFVDLGTGRTAKSISTNGHTCAVLDNGWVKCWGGNLHGQLGLGDVAFRGDNAGEMGDALPAVALGTGRTAKSVLAGENHSCALLDDGSLKCWGFNNHGQLGLGDTNSRGDTPDEMGDALPAIDLGTGRKAVQIALAHEATCALLDNGRIKCWGSGQYHLAGQGDSADRGKSAGQMGDALPYVDLGTGHTAKYVAVGYAHACAILDDDSVKCWGYNLDGRLGLGDLNSRGDATGEMGDALPTVSLGTGLTPKELVGGGSQTCAMLTTGGVKCWGLGSPYNGLGDTVTRGTSLTQMGDALPFVSYGTSRTPVSFTGGWNTVCLVFSNDTTKCWGANNYGQLGLGDFNARGDNAGEMGDLLPAIVL